MKGKDVTMKGASELGDKEAPAEGALEERSRIVFQWGQIEVVDEVVETLEDDLKRSESANKWLCGVDATHQGQCCQSKDCCVCNHTDLSPKVITFARSMYR